MAKKGSLAYDTSKAAANHLVRELAMELLGQGGEKAQIRCQRCDKFVPLWDALEKRFASEAIRQKVEALRVQEYSKLDSRRQGKLLALEASARITSANQSCHEIPGDVDEGIDLVVEFTDDEGHGTGKHMYVQLKAGNSFLKKRKGDGAEQAIIELVGSELVKRAAERAKRREERLKAIQQGKHEGEGEEPAE